jgi:ribonucleotide reductase alpha subunit
MSEEPILIFKVSVSGWDAEMTYSELKNKYRVVTAPGSCIYLINKEYTTKDIEPYFSCSKNVSWIEREINFFDVLNGDCIHYGYGDDEDKNRKWVHDKFIEEDAKKAKKWYDMFKN